MNDSTYSPDNRTDNHSEHPSQCEPEAESPAATSKKLVFQNEFSPAELEEKVVDLFFSNFGGDITVLAKEIASAVGDALKLKNNVSTASPEPVGVVVSYGDYGYPWKRIDYIYDSVLADLPVGTMVYAATPDQLTEIAELTRALEESKARVNELESTFSSVQSLISEAGINVKQCKQTG